MQFGHSNKSSTDILETINPRLSVKTKRKEKKELQEFRMLPDVHDLYLHDLMLLRSVLYPFAYFMRFCTEEH